MGSEGWCVQDREVWHAVLGNYHPDTEEFLQTPDPAKERYVQRACDQNLVTYTRVEFMLPGCPVCRKIHELMVEFTPEYTEETEEDGAVNGVGESLVTP